MADSTSIEQPFPIFFDKAGKPLDSGYVYIGEYGKNPQTDPIQTFWDEALTQPAVQPIRTINGYYSRYGTPSRVFIQGISCSITVRDKYQTVVYSELKTSGKVAGLLNASVILDDSGLTQQQINDKTITTVNSIADLIAIQNPKNYQTVFVKSRNTGTGKGGGAFVFHVGSTKNDGGQFFKTSTGSWHRVILEVWRNIQWWGAIGDGITDDTQSIKNAVQAMGNIETWNGGGNPTDGSFCTLYVPPSNGNYIVSDTIYLPPYLRLKGDSAKGGSLAAVYSKNISVIEAKFPLAENYKWVISTVNRVRATGELTTWDSVYSGAAYDNGIVTGCFGTSVEDLVVVNNSTEHRVYGGIRMQNAPQCSVERVLVEGFDVCVFSCGSWDSRFDVGTKAYKCGVHLFGDMNGARLSGYQHGTKGGIAPMSQQMEVLKTNDTTSGLPFDTSTKKYGVYVSYAYGFSSSSLICEYHDVGVLTSQSVGNIAALYCEGNTTSIADIASDLNIGSVTGVSNTYALALGTKSNVTIGTIVNDHAGTFIQSASQYGSKVTVPKTVNVPHNHAIHFIGGNDTVYLDATNGKDTNSGLHYLYPVKTMTQALLSASNIDNNTWDSGVVTQKKADRTIVILDSSEYQLTTWASITNMDLTVKPISTSLTPRLRVSNYNYIVKNCNILISGVNVFRSYDDSYQPSQGFFICSGDCSITVDTSIVNLDYHLVSVNPTEKSKVKVNVTGSTGAMGGYAKYLNTTSKNVFAEVFVRLNNTVNNLNGSADNGVSAPPEAYIIKSVNGVL